MSATKLEQEALEYLLGLDALKVGLGVRADGIRRRTLAEIFPLLRHQRALLKRAEALGQPLDPAQPFTRPGINPAAAARLDAEALRLEDDICAAWSRCLEQLHALYLTECAVVEVAP